LKNKTTYEMEDVMNLIAKDLADKGLAPDPGSIEIWARIDGARVPTKEIEVEVNVSWVGIPPQDDEPSPPRARARRVPEPDVDSEPESQDLLDEAPRPGAAPALEIGIDDVTAASAKISRSGGAGPFAPERVKRRLMNDESTEWPGSPPPRGR
jgi:hypothetical protein